MCFNPHTHAGCDFVIIPLIRQVCVSIHTPTQGVTLLGSDIIKSFSSFNPHTHAGCDFSSIFCEFHGMFQSTHPRRVWQMKLENGTILLKFQSTHPRRVWPFPVLCACRLVGFNPHTHAGCDIHRPRDVLITVSFNPHTHAGCDTLANHIRAFWHVSIHTPTQGVTSDTKIIQKDSTRVSIHTPTQGVTLLAGCCVSF